MSGGARNDTFDDLEEMDHSDIKEMRGDLERDLRSVDRQHRAVSYTHLTLPTIYSV